MGFEPTTFCMAIRPVFKTSRQRIWPLAGVFVAARQTATISNTRGYASICSDLGTSVEKCPKSEVAV
jgi:hypothetical protein